MLHEDSILDEKFNKNVFFTLLEYIDKNTKILNSSEYFMKELPKDAEKVILKYLQSNKKYLGKFPLKDVKDDLYSFVKDFVNEIQSIKDIENIRFHKSKDIGFSNYIEFDVVKPVDEKLKSFVNSNIDRYNGVTIRFSDHTYNSENNNRRNPDIKVGYHNRTFNDAQKEAIGKIKKYVKDLRNDENNYLNNGNDSGTQNENLHEEFMKNGNFIVYSQKILRLADIDSMEGKKLTNWNQVVRFCLQQLRLNRWVEIIDMKTFNAVWLKPDSLEQYIQSGGILDQSRD
jgi:hypothetical protein